MGIMRDSLLWRYLTFVWLFDEVPPRAALEQKAAIVRRNRERGLRYLPVYMWRYARMLVVFVSGGTATEALASPQLAPLVSGTLFTLSTVVLIALLLAGLGFAAMRLRAFDHARW
jgi:uncharacterized membrane protein YhaH (DUF805 family)